MEKRASFTGCDPSRWGKCVFGGRFLSIPDKPPIHALQWFWHEREQLQAVYRDGLLTVTGKVEG